MSSHPLTLGRAWDVLEVLVPKIAETCPSIDCVTPAGDVRRFEPLISTLVVVCRAADPVSAIGHLCSMPGVEVAANRNGRGVSMRLHNTDVELAVVAPDEYGGVLFETTGARAHVNAIRARAASERCADERQIYAQAGLPWIEPELRQGTDELGAAAADSLPRLVTREDIRGDLHMHSTYSDGRDTAAAMIEACHALGYQYVAVTDHSEGAAASRTLAFDEIAVQREELEALRARYPSMTILHGVEVDITPAGRLDFSDDVLERFDIVLASLHEHAGHDRARLTRRCIDAIRHPLVNILCHPANRLVGHRDGYDLDFEAVYAAAAETRTVLEIDGAPSHLDLDGEHARAAAAAGATLVIDSDCHRATWLERQMFFGIGTARRGWVEPQHLLNTRTAADVVGSIAAKRRGQISFP